MANVFQMLGNPSPITLGRGIREAFYGNAMIKPTDERGNIDPAICMGGAVGIRFVGGGAVLFGKALQTAVPAATVGDEFANARGVLEYMLAQQLPE